MCCEAAKAGEFGDAVEAGQEQAGVDGAGDGGAGVERGDDGGAEDIGDVVGG